MRALLRTVLRAFVRITGRPAGPHITRYVMYARLGELAAQLPQTASTSVLSISHSADLCEVPGLDRAKVQEANHPDVTVLDLPFADESFDYVISDQVLEHVEGDPFLAVAETLRVVRPGGFVVHTTCFMNPVHGSPGDFWRFTPQALSLLVGDKADVVESGAWGNPFVWMVAALGLRYTPVPHARWHPLHRVATSNNVDWPVVTWIVARKR